MMFYQLIIEILSNYECSWYEMLQGFKKKELEALIMEVLPPNSEGDYSNFSFATIFVVFLLTVLSLWYLEVPSLMGNSTFQFHSNIIPVELLALFRTACFLLSAYTIVILMVRSTDPGTMIALRHKENDYHLFELLGLERLVSFSSWTLMIFGTAFLFASIGTWHSVFDIEVPDWITIFSSVLYSIALGCVFLTSTVVRYIIIPTEIKMERDFDHLFKTHESIMHNVAIILIVIDMIVTKPNLQPEFGLFGIIIGIIYLTFAYLWAFFGGGYYIYTFIDPRMKSSPQVLIGLAFSIGLFYLGVWIISKIMDELFLLGVLIIVLWVSQITMFKKPDAAKKIELIS